MTTRVTITGSGSPIPSATRAGPGVLVRTEELALQFDAGRSTVQRLAACRVLPRALDAVFVTHHHSDHLTALQDIVLTRWTVGGASAPSLPIVVPRGPAVAFVERMLDAWDADIAVRNEHTGRTDQPGFDVVPFDVGDDVVEVWSRGDVRVLAGPVRHEPVTPAVGYRVETPDGTIAITGDTLVCDEVAALATGADVVVYEAMLFDRIRPIPAMRFVLDYHADTKLIGAQMAELAVDTLVLTHLIPAPDTAADQAQYVDEIRAGGFTGTLIVADDLTTVEL